MLPARDTLTAEVLGGYVDNGAAHESFPVILTEIEKEMGVVVTCTHRLGTCVYAGKFAGSEPVFHCWLTVNPAVVSNDKAREAYEAFAKKWGEKNDQQVVPVYFHQVIASAAKKSLL